MNIQITHVAADAEPDPETQDSDAETSGGMEDVADLIQKGWKLLKNKGSGSNWPTVSRS